MCKRSYSTRPWGQECVLIPVALGLPNEGDIVYELKTMSFTSSIVA